METFTFAINVCNDLFYKALFEPDERNDVNRKQITTESKNICYLVGERRERERTSERQAHRKSKSLHYSTRMHPSIYLDAAIPTERPIRSDR